MDHERGLHSTNHPDLRQAGKSLQFLDALEGLIVYMIEFGRIGLTRKVIIHQLMHGPHRVRPVIPQTGLVEGEQPDFLS